MACLLVCVLFGMQGEEGPPSLEYIQAKDLFPQKELVKEEESLQVRMEEPRKHPLWGLVGLTLTMPNLKGFPAKGTSTSLTEA